MWCKLCLYIHTFLLSVNPNTDYAAASSLWGPPKQFNLRHSVSGRIPAATMLRPDTAMASFRYRTFPLHTQYSIDDEFISRPSIPKTHMPHSALKKQVQRGWAGSHYVREMSVGTGRDTMKLGQWNDISAWVSFMLHAPPQWPSGKAFALRAGDTGIEACFPWLSHTSDPKFGALVVTLLGALHYKINARTCRPGVCVLFLGDSTSLLCNFQLSVAAGVVVLADPVLKYNSMLLGH